MNIKAEKMNKFLIDNKLTARGREVPGDALHTIYLNLGSVHGFEYLIQIDDSPIIGVKAIFARNVDPNTEGLLSLLNRLSGKYKTHSYIVDKEGFLCAPFAALVDDNSFSPDLFIDYCTLVDHCIADDLPEMFELLGLELPENFNAENNEESEAEAVAETSEAEKDAGEALGE